MWMQHIDQTGKLWKLRACIKDTEVAIHGGIQGVLKHQAGTATVQLISWWNHLSGLKQVHHGAQGVHERHFCISWSSIVNVCVSGLG